GKGVIGIKLEEDDSCLGGALVSNRHDALIVETTGGVERDFRRGAYPCVNRGCKGHEVIKRGGLVRVLPPPIDLVAWEALEGGNGNGGAKSKENGKHEGNGKAKGTLFE